MWKDALPPLLAFASLVIALFGLRDIRLPPTGVMLLRRMAACFSTIVLLGVLKIILTINLGEESPIVSVADLSLSFVSTFVLVIGGIEIINHESVTPSLKRFAGAAVPALMYQLTQPNLPMDPLSGLDIIRTLKAIDSATSAAAGIFIGITIGTRLFISGNTFLSAFTVIIFTLWSVPEAIYWTNGPDIARYLMLIGGVSVAITSVMAARRMAA
jgi:hypothetical protein